MTRTGKNCHILKMLLSQGRHLSFHMPGHKKKGADITELPYSDCLLNPTGVIAAAERDIAEILGAEKSFILTDGSTSGVFSMLYALKEAGKHTVAVPENSHRSVYNACAVLGLKIEPVVQKTCAGVPKQPEIEAIERALSRADALLLTSPDYYGYLAPLKEAKALCTAQEKPLVVDGAHGSHLHFTDLHAGKYADLWVDGVHKSLPSLTQGAVVSAKGNFAEYLGHGVKIFRTTSPSYPIMASVEYAVKYPRNLKTERLALSVREEIGALENDDWTKLVVPFGEQADAAQAALEGQGIYPEFNDGNYLMFYLSPCTKAKELKTLVRALNKLPRGEVKGDVPAGTIPIYSE